MGFSAENIEVKKDNKSSMREDGNNVDIEQETMASTQNQMMYELMTSSVSSQFRRITSVLK